MNHWFCPMRRSQPLGRWRVAALPPLCLLLSAAILLRLPPVHADEHPSAPLVLELTLDGEVEPILATYIDEGLADAAKRHAALVLITMDTPGGLSDSMKDMIQHILASPVPVAVYVSPTGGRGASAGFYILLSADIAAMAPGTHAGAASPIIAIGGFPQQIDEVFRRKINQDAMAFLRSFTERRKRNPELAEKAITESKAFTEKEALDAKMIDLIANSTDDLLRQLDGRAIARFDGTQVTLSLKNASRATFELSARQRFLARIVEPDVFFVLLILGVLGLYTEFTHPGVIAPGVIGGICCVFHIGGKSPEPRSPGFRRRGIDVFGRSLLDTLATHVWRSEHRRGAGGNAALRGARRGSDAPRVAFAALENSHREGRAHWIAGRRGCAIALGRRGHDSRTWRTVARRIIAARAGRRDRPGFACRGTEALR